VKAAVPNISFQSSPGFGAGRYRVFSLSGAAGRCFNPRPALGPGATVQLQANHTTKKFFAHARTGDLGSDFLAS